ncbi:hypothetical protein HU200_029232 [Digitaria exilis]|uniref:Protein kinase domain-containing protein n=1 Tax=Digitaria exilis TaxID=1010633 RepID=A0A835BYX8_9POAL|nr:hypothetical protein HU200_029232 [Digitaria exilis]
MAPTSTAVLFPAVVAALMAMTLQLSAAAAPAPPPIGKPGCNTTCGDVSVPYPFGFGPSHCYWEGLNLTCDTSHDGGTPRLLLGDGSLRVTGINVSDTEPTIRVVRAGSLINSTAGGRWNAPFGRGFTEHGYLLSGDNELVVFGCNVVATLLVDGIEAAKTNNTAGIIGGCTSLCAKRFDSFGQFFIDTWDVDDVPGDDDCSDGMSGCCRSPVTMPAPLREVQAMRLHSGSDTAEEKQLPVNVFVAEKGWIDELHNMSMRADEVREVPFVLQWSVTHGLPPGPELDDRSICTDEVHRMLCKSNNSICWNAIPGPGYTCQCEVGYEGNPYLAGAGGCKDDVLLPTVDPQPIALPNNCNHTCGDVRVPYPLGFGPSRCYWPGLNLTCDTSHGGPPRLLLDSNGTLQVIGVSLSDSTLRVVHHTRITPDDVVFDYSVNLPRVNGHKVITSDVSFQLPHIDIDECKITPQRCFGHHCHNMAGTYKCTCRLGTFGNANKPDGCVSLSSAWSKFAKKNKIALSAASGPVLLLLGLGIILVRRKIEQHKMKVLKQKYFKQNRGQLLQQLMSHRADIAERMIIQLDELAKATNNFDKARELGGGGHGTVYKGILSDLHVVAIKKSKITVQKEINEFINEVAILSQVNHKNVVKLLGCCLETEVPLLVYEFISNGTLYDHLHVEGPRSLSWANRLRIATEIATSLAYLHSAVSIPIIHRDIKSSNVLLDDTLTAKVSDFGASRYIPVDKTGLTTRVQGTIGYLDPMYFQTNRLTEKSDVYSFGVILVELLTRKKPFSYLSPEADGLVSHFLDLHVEGNLIQIIDPQVIEEGGEEVQEVAALAASCINLLRGDERPIMRQVEHTLEGIRGSRMPENHGMVVANMENDSVEFSCPLSAKEGQRFQESSRRYSLEQEMMMSARYPR